MLSEFRKSVNYVIYERTTSPLWGAFIFSWLICNWKIVFTVFVVGEGHLNSNKIDYIQNNFIDWKPLILYPFISTAILITVFPILGNLAYWITIIYSKWRLDKKNEVEKKQLLSIEQSIALRTSVNQIQESYIKLNTDKDTEINALKLEIDELNNRLNESISIDNIVPNNNKRAVTTEWKEDYQGFKTSTMFDEFRNLLSDVNSMRGMGSYATKQSAIIYFQSLGLIEKNSHGAAYDLTEKGMYFSKIYNKELFESNNSLNN